MMAARPKWRWLNPDTLVEDSGHRPVVLAAGLNHELRERHAQTGLLVRFNPSGGAGQLIESAPDWRFLALELLAFAMATYRREGPNDRFGRFDDAELERWRAAWFKRAGLADPETPPAPTACLVPGCTHPDGRGHLGGCKVEEMP